MHTVTLSQRKKRKKGTSEVPSTQHHCVPAEEGTTLRGAELRAISVRCAQSVAAVICVAVVLFVSLPIVSQWCATLPRSAPRRIATAATSTPTQLTEIIEVEPTSETSSCTLPHLQDKSAFSRVCLSQSRTSACLTEHPTERCPLGECLLGKLREIPLHDAVLSLTQKDVVTERYDKSVQLQHIEGTRWGKVRGDALGEVGEVKTVMREVVEGLGGYEPEGEEVWVIPVGAGFAPMRATAHTVIFFLEGSVLLAVFRRAYAFEVPDVPSATWFTEGLPKVRRSGNTGALCELSKGDVLFVPKGYTYALLGKGGDRVFAVKSTF